MKLWSIWIECVMELRPACARLTTFLWMLVCLMAITIRSDRAGVTSFVRALGLQPYCYDRLLDFLHSKSLDLKRLTELWVQLVLRIFPQPLRINGRMVLVGDGIKVSKEGIKMPAVKSLHQESDSNTKAEYIMGHSCQAVALLVGAIDSFFAVPLSSRIHEGLVFSNRHKHTLLDKMVSLIESLKMTEPLYFVADAYYAARPIIQGMLKNGHHLVTRLKSNAVASLPAHPKNTKKPHRGRPKTYGNKIKVKNLFKQWVDFETVKSPLYGEKNTTLQFRSFQFYWRRAGLMVLYVLVIHPQRGRIMLMCTDLSLSPIEVIKLYGLRYKIELSFKQALRVLGAYTYHFWMKSMDSIDRRSGNQYLHRKSQEYRDAVVRKISAYHRHIQLGLIAQGLLQYLACTAPQLVWEKFGSWIRTIRPGIPPSEQVTAMALKNSFPEFLADTTKSYIYKKFLRDRIDLSRAEGYRLVA